MRRKYAVNNLQHTSLTPRVFHPTILLLLEHTGGSDVFTEATWTAYVVPAYISRAHVIPDSALLAVKF